MELSRTINVFHRNKEMNIRLQGHTSTPQSNKTRISLHNAPLNYSVERLQRNQTFAAASSQVKLKPIRLGSHKDPVTNEVIPQGSSGPLNSIDEKPLAKLEQKPNKNQSLKEKNGFPDKLQIKLVKLRTSTKPKEVFDTEPVSPNLE